MCGFASGYHYAYFDDFRIDRLNDAPPESVSLVRRMDLNHYEVANAFANSDEPGTQIKLGARILVKQAIEITGLGRFRINRNKATHAVSVYDAETLEWKGGADVLMSDPVNPRSVNYSAIEMDYFHGFVYAPARLTLQPGAYLIVSDETVGGDKWYGGERDLPILESEDPDVVEIECGIRCMGTPGLRASWTDSLSEGKLGSCYGPVNFRYQRHNNL